ncbi:PTS sugar transporter subunit IIA [Xenorhabdus bovienii]|uniref:PTS sugar transporter subunit IIA n=1 Tax=Xenorhabdus bovienii TaxID=40576 RepID=UPI00237C89BA|nr:PTS sugar transporter subunit IIA [Xenorhabdus bovienii]MDE1475744.1 PTS sugar transporter subunit IIA [Xenorhabdus bovienii]MDE1483433.1 PTS sugar transporter subunit IIA [Xenorhabdus bovienii]MDE9428183.1 PTS sugar transporter subunit IIA [Xenorhabdus bovienii]MDE9436694.1 PTS sugar transporter subunit IIA [Xenorhabdus bovienii]MDE9458865.1 PTS sugar transporter subunit IIA [Xenorhabdus bovienii]
MLNNLLSPDVIQRISSVKDWREAIAISCQPLINNGAIEPRYVDAICRSHEELGPYYVVGSGIAMPHARPEEGANRLALSLTVISKGVPFGSEGNDPIKLLIVLAATDSSSHIGAIAKLAELFDSQQDINRLIQASSQEEILLVIQHY